MGSLYRPKLRSGKLSSKWWVKYYVNGRPIRESTGAEKEQDATRRVLVRKGLLTNEEVLEEIKVVRREMEGKRGR